MRFSFCDELLLLWLTDGVDRFSPVDRDLEIAIAREIGSWYCYTFTLTPNQDHPTMTPEELSQVADIHQSVLNRHDREIAASQALQKLATMQRDDDLRAVNKVLDRIAQSQEQTQAQQQLNTQEISRLAAGMIDLRDQIANFIQSREQPK